MGQEQPHQLAPQARRRPRSRPQEALVRVVGVLAVWVADADHAGHRAPAGAEHPGPDLKQPSRRSQAMAVGGRAKAASRLTTPAIS